MMYKWLGAVFIIISCGGFGFYLVYEKLLEEQLLKQLQSTVDYMICEIQFRLTPLSGLCRSAAEGRSLPLRLVFLRLAEELDNQFSPDAPSCMNFALSEFDNLPKSVRKELLQIGRSLGQFDLPGQVFALEKVSRNCTEDLQNLQDGKELRFRSYRTLGICAGIALTIILL